MQDPMDESAVRQVPLSRCRKPCEFIAAFLAGAFFVTFRAEGFAVLTGAFFAGAFATSRAGAFAASTEVAFVAITFVTAAFFATAGAAFFAAACFAAHL